MLDITVLRAIADRRHPDHERCTAIYSDLIDDFVNRRCLITARREHLDEFRSETDLFAAVDALHEAGQHRNAALEAAQLTGLSADEALTLVIYRRAKVARMVTINDTLASVAGVTAD